MIIDNIRNCEKYECVHEGFKKAFDAIKEIVSENKGVGKYEIDGKNVFVMVQEYTSKLEADCKFEAHRKYIDIQFIISGEEKIYIGPLEGLKPVTEFNTESDGGLFEAPQSYTTAVVADGDFAIIYPDEAHAPGISINENQKNIRKIVAKVLL